MCHRMSALSGEAEVKSDHTQNNIYKQKWFFSFVVLILIKYFNYIYHVPVYIVANQRCYPIDKLTTTLQCRYNGHDGVSNHQPHDCLLNRLFRCRSKKTSKLRVAGLCVGNSPGTDEFPAQMASNEENASIWWRHHEVRHESF